MKTVNFSTSACRYCRYYNPEGRRGGMCQQLNVPVQSNWKACSLALPPFAPSWEHLEELIAWQHREPVLPEIHPLVSALDCSSLALTELGVNSPSQEEPTGEPVLV